MEESDSMDPAIKDLSVVGFWIEAVVGLVAVVVEVAVVRLALDWATGAEGLPAIKVLGVAEDGWFARGIGWGTAVF